LEELVDLIIAQLRSPLFWVMTVLAGSIVGVLGNYATRLIDRGGSSATSWLRGVSRRRSARRTERFMQLSLWLDQHENGAVLAKLQAITFRMHAVLTAIGAICCFALSYFFSPKNQFSPTGILLFATGVMLAVMVVAFIRLADDLDSIVATHRKGMGTYPGPLVRSERMKAGVGGANQDGD
jgi:ABC-type phosphate/phosphonate transport system permease subunit